MTYGLLGKFTAQAGTRDDLVGYLLQAAKLLERNPGCIHYVVSTSDEPEAVWVTEVWVDQTAHDASLEPEDIRALIQEARPLIAGMSDQTRLTVQGGKGLPGGEKIAVPVDTCEMAYPPARPQWPVDEDDSSTSAWNPPSP